MAAGSPEQHQRSMVVRETVELTDKEEQIFQLLLDVVDHFGLGTQLRVAGGWVRDKVKTADIDIALDDITGQNFCKKISEYSELVGKKQKRIGVSKCNPDRSKHLETAQMRILDIRIDFVNLRSEKYAENSRIHTMVRTSARFNFKFAEGLKEAASDEKVKSELGSKISRERIGAKINLMMADKQLVKAMCDIRDLGLFYAVFSFPEKSTPPVFDKCDCQCVLHIEAAWNLANSIDSSVFSIGFDESDPKLQDERRRLCLYSALFIPLRNMFHLDRRSNKVPVSSYIIKDSLKLEGSDAKMVVNIHASSEKFAELILLLESTIDVGTLKETLADEFLEIPADSVKRVFAGLILREIKDFWRVALLISILSYPEAENAGDILNKQDELHRRKKKYIRVERSITDIGLDGVWNLKPVLDGDSIKEVIQVKPGGPLVGEWLRREMKWQLAHPNGTRDECIEWMKQSRSKRQKVESGTG